MVPLVGIVVALLVCWFAGALVAGLVLGRVMALGARAAAEDPETDA
jgi:F0F1-type ATP synthase membrane subunit c/vacuolar-type H+-ATPase subunit K